MTKIQNPFTADDKKAIIESIRMLDEMVPIINKSKTCGVECDELERRINTNRKRLNAFLTQFWPEESI